MDVVVKVLARILQERLQKLCIAGEELPVLQCGFRKGRSCASTIFTVCQLIEQSMEHNSKSFLTIIDVRKAYVSLPREAVWMALGKLGVPDKVVMLVRSFHQDMKARFHLDGVDSEDISVQNGLR